MKKTSSASKTLRRDIRGIPGIHFVHAYAAGLGDSDWFGGVGFRKSQLVIHESGRTKPATVRQALEWLARWLPIAERKGMLFAPTLEKTQARFYRLALASVR
jgi:hypothetical protein